MSKVFGYPKFDQAGEMILTTYGGDYAAMLMDIRVYQMKAGETRSFCRPGEEIAVLLLSGKADGDPRPVYKKRAELFQPPLPSEGRPLEILLQGQVRRRGPAKGQHDF